MSYADEVFIANCKDILENGTWDTDYNVRPHWEDGTPAHTIKKFGIVNRYDLSKEFPAMTLRKTFIKSATDELLWIWQKKSNNVNDFKGHVWDAWANEDGSIGKAYGYQLGVKHHYPEGDFDQVDRVLYDLKHNPLTDKYICPRRPERDEPLPLRLQHDFQCHWQEAQRDTQPALAGYAHGKQLERLPICDARSHDSAGLGT